MVTVLESNDYGGTQSEGEPRAQHYLVLCCRNVAWLHWPPKGAQTSVNPGTWRVSLWCSNGVVLTCS
jgi:hypothetical protein